MKPRKPREPKPDKPRRKPGKPRKLTEKRLRSGAILLKTSSADAKHGAFWTYVDSGKLAAAGVCHRLERQGMLISDDGLIAGAGGQTYRLRPPL
jgi:hypothetical protein